MALNLFFFVAHFSCAKIMWPNTFLSEKKGLEQKTTPDLSYEIKYCNINETKFFTIFSFFKLLCGQPQNVFMVHQRTMTHWLRTTVLGG